MIQSQKVEVLDTSETGSALAPRERDPVGLARVEPPSIASILHLAVEKDMDPASLEKLVDLYERISDRDAAKEYAAAMARFQSKCPPIRKTSKANVTSRSKGTTFSYNWAELDEIARTIGPILSEEGLSYTWDSEEDKGRVVCTCHVRHINGHTSKASFSCSTDTDAGMSNQQKSAAALTYAKRQSLVQALGLTTCDPDTDGAPPPRRTPAADKPITPHQVSNLDMMIENVHANKPAFLKVLGVPSLSDLPAYRFQEAVDMLEKKRRQQEQGGGR